MSGAYTARELKDLDKRLRKMYDRGEEAASKNNIPYAMTMFRELLKKEPGLLDVRKRLRELQFQQLGKPSAFHQWVTCFIAIPVWIFNMFLMRKGDDASLIKTMDNAEAMLSIDCTAMLPLVMLDRAAFEADLPDVSVLTLEWAVNVYPKSIFLWDRLGQAYMGAGRGTKCLEVYKKLCELQPQNGKWQDAMKDATAEAAMDAGGWNKVDRGEGDYHELIRNKDEAARLEHAGHTVRTAEGIETLIEGVLELLETQDTADHRRRLADLYLEAKHYDKAIEAYESVNEKLGLTDPAIEQAILKVKITRFDERIKEQQEIADDVTRDDAERRAATEQAEALRSEKVDALLTSMRDRVKRFPNQVEDRMQLAKMLIDDGQIDEAISHFQRLQSHPKLTTTATFFLGRCFYAKKVYDLAIEQYQHVIDDVQNMTSIKKDAYYELAKTYEALGEQEQAVANYKTIYSVDTKYRDVGEIIDSLYKD